MDHKGAFFGYINCKILRASGGFAPWTSGITFTNNRVKEKHINFDGKTLGKMGGNKKLRENCVEKSVQTL